MTQLELPESEQASGAAEQRWTRRTEYALAAAAIVFLGAYAWPILQPHLAHGARRACEIVVYVVWALFAVDYLARLYLARPRWTFFKRNLIDLASIVLPVLRPLRLLRLVALVRVLNRRATSSLHGRVAIYVISSAVLVVFIAALSVLDAERAKAHANISNFGDAAWWAVTTMTTVGYGDHYPVTATGRWVAVGLMVAGISLLGIVTASIATWLIGRVRDVEITAEDRVAERIDELHQQVRELKAMVASAFPAEIVTDGGQK